MPVEGVHPAPLGPTARGGGAAPAGRAGPPEGCPLLGALKLSCGSLPFLYLFLLFPRARAREGRRAFIHAAFRRFLNCSKCVIFPVYCVIFPVYASFFRSCSHLRPEIY